MTKMVPLSIFTTMREASPFRQSVDYGNYFLISVGQHISLMRCESTAIAEVYFEHRGRAHILD